MGDVRNLFIEPVRPQARETLDLRPRTLFRSNSATPDAALPPASPPAVSPAAASPGRDCAPTYPSLLGAEWAVVPVGATDPHRLTRYAVVATDPQTLTPRVVSEWTDIESAFWHLGIASSSTCA